ncbi:DUF3667 domain-containing protein [Trinickia fusca]|uniref:DUF3667 domain-containing protein n=1 Tax=Trinickia fusca TaxID=2419777 RepID=UPI001600B4C7|nr:DUF3667 domain-containing protein [Trinickia fusca]
MPTLREFAHEYLHHYVAADGKLLPTLKLLLLKPGQLTLEYLAGRRQRYVKPLSLYVTFSFLFFLFLSLTSSSTPDHFVYVDNRPVAHPEQHLAGLAAAKADPDERKVLGALASAVSELQDPDKLAEFREHLLHRLPYAIFALMPIFAAMCALVYRRRRQNYGMHVLFTLHLNAFIFAVFLLGLIPAVQAHAAWAASVIFLYLVVALKRVHGGRWWPQLARGMLLGSCYVILSSVAIGAAMAASAGVQWHLH